MFPGGRTDLRYAYLIVRVRDPHGNEKRMVRYSRSDNTERLLETVEKSVPRLCAATPEGGGFFLVQRKRGTIIIKSDDDKDPAATHAALSTRFSKLKYSTYSVELGSC